MIKKETETVEDCAGIPLPFSISDLPGKNAKSEEIPPVSSPEYGEGGLANGSDGQAISETSAASANNAANDAGLRNFRKHLAEKELFSLSNRVTAAFWVTMVIMTLWSYAFYGIARLFNSDIRSLYFLLARPENSNLIQVILSVLAFMLPFSLLARALRLDSTEMCFGKPIKGRMLAPYLIGVGICNFANIGVMISSRLLESMGINYTVNTDIDLPSGFSGSLLYILTVSFVPALVEEYALRGVTLGALKKYGTGFAVIVSSVFFGLMHSNFEQIPFTFICGIGMALGALASGSVWTSVLIHFTNNFVSVLLEILAKNVSYETENAVFLLYCALTLGLAVAAAFKADKGGYLIPENTDVSGLTAGEKIKSFFVAPVFIIYFVTIMYIAVTVYGSFG